MADASLVVLVFMLAALPGNFESGSSLESLANAEESEEDERFRVNEHFYDRVAHFRDKMSKSKKKSEDDEVNVEEEYVREGDDIWAKEEDIPKQFRNADLKAMNDKKWISARLNEIQIDADDGELEKGVVVVDGIEMDAVLLDLIESSRFDLNGNPSTINERKESICQDAHKLCQGFCNKHPNKAGYAVIQSNARLMISSLVTELAALEYMKRKCKFDGKAERVLEAYLEGVRAKMSGEAMEGSHMNDTEQDAIPLGVAVPCSPEEWMADLKRFVKLKDFQSIAMILEQIKEANLNGNDVLEDLVVLVRKLRKHESSKVKKLSTEVFETWRKQVRGK
ncbi:hypothetical protein GUITHDRAFT_142634 [Guillardia theta CCMP2712]|uniref:TFIIS N-terminal domain-containing protein n=1 Tax=Guillardia theta (strain CCMP2712) TaxID=905079 RepID=L1IW82_GUITC|nr:hypothetical protein GUITHDRAFT_142634 [Guillardia theta CCMP2712]EKX40523.1 hypothetical protein GUITHDRAFT_142634 [Guillardia theta CCMP2712]|eukprot:XP_005827503.1 hypothetical protein GUITHDRAFT_142634 [Guillardia theta CCMP2712]